MEIPPLNPLHEAARLNRVDTITLLLEARSDPATRNNAGHCALFVACVNVAIEAAYVLRPCTACMTPTEWIDALETVLLLHLSQEERERYQEFAGFLLRMNLAPLPASLVERVACRCEQMLELVLPFAASLPPPTVLIRSLCIHGDNYRLYPTFDNLLLLLDAGVCPTDAERMAFKEMDGDEGIGARALLAYYDGELIDTEALHTLCRYQSPHATRRLLGRFPIYCRNAKKHTLFEQFIIDVERYTVTEEARYRTLCVLLEFGARLPPEDDNGIFAEDNEYTLWGDIPRLRRQVLAKRRRQWRQLGLAWP